MTFIRFREGEAPAEPEAGSAGASPSRNHETQSRMTMSYLEELFGLSGQTAVVIGGAGVLGGASCAGLRGPGHT